MSRTLEEAIEHAEYIASKYSGAVSICWSANDNRQLAAWLRELQERRKAPEIIRCTECKNKSFCPSKIDCGDGLYWYVRFCSRGEQDKKRTDEVHTVENCCKNCEYSGNYDGWNEFICKYYNDMIRNEQYDCEGFKPEREN